MAAPQSLKRAKGRKFKLPLTGDSRFGFDISVGGLKVGVR
jgi:hypothetical protein